jgi:hypothetical protein
MKTVDYGKKRNYIIAMKNKTSSISAFSLAIVMLGMAFSVISADYMNRKIKEIELEKPFYLKRTNAQWEKQGRIIGEIKNTPKSFTIDICVQGSRPAKIIKTETFNINLTVYETCWLGVGAYDIVIKSEGYIDQTVKDVTIKPYADCVMNIVFGLTEYKR